MIMPYVVQCDEKGKRALNKDKSIIIARHIPYKEDVLQLISQADDIKRLRYAFEVRYRDDAGQHFAMIIRGHDSTNAQETAAGYYCRQLKED